jgi:2Fe-2S ferredoxin
MEGVDSTRTRRNGVAGSNPYIEDEGAPPPNEAYTLTILPLGITIEVKPESVPYGQTGLPGSVLDIALAHGIEIEHTCGGVVACSTCHCVIREGWDTIPESTDDEEDMLDNAPGLETTSRLSCQAVPSGSQHVVVEIPSWNRNAVKEGH